MTEEEQRRALEMSLTAFQRRVCRLISSLRFEGEGPSAAALSHRWRAAIRQAREIVEVLPADRVGSRVLDSDETLFTAGVPGLVQAIRSQRPVFRPSAFEVLSRRFGGRDGTFDAPHA